MSAKGAKLEARKRRGGPRHHHCPACIGRVGIGDETLARAVMVMPKKKMVFICKSGHRLDRGQTVLA
jgi:hypothetical protein